MTSKRPCWRSKTKKRRPCWRSEILFWGLNSIFMQIPPFVSLCKYGFWSHALSIILPGVSYQEALCQSGLAPLEARRAESCVNFIKCVKSGNPLLPICEVLLLNNESKYNLRHQLQHKVIVNTNRFKDFVTFCYVHSIVN